MNPVRQPRTAHRGFFGLLRGRVSIQEQRRRALGIDRGGCAGTQAEDVAGPSNAHQHSVHGGGAASTAHEPNAHERMDVDDPTPALPEQATSGWVSIKRSTMTGAKFEQHLGDDVPVAECVDQLALYFANEHLVDVALRRQLPCLTLYTNLADHQC